MAEIKIPEIRPSGTIEGKVDALYDAYYLMHKWVDYAFSGVLDSSNVIEAATVKADWIYAGTIKANQIDVSEGKITTAQIENLTVGTNVTMGPNAEISWGKVTGAPSIPSQYTDSQALNAWKNSGYATYIDANGVYSGSFNGGMFNINPTGDRYLLSGLTIGGYYGSSWTGEALKVQFDEHGHQSFPGTIVSSQGGIPVVFQTMVEFQEQTNFRGTVDFGGSNVLNLPSVICKFG
jgi:hypothetical protein